ncbi:MAG TPA: adenosylcobalamin-dependent ribonucleoside-diphosphate reductase [Terriglobia bacterium]|jgi:ribonucleoside-diphosphate reductase alpha chain
MRQIEQPRILDERYNPSITDNSMYILRFRYLLKREDGTLETPVEMFRRVAWNIAEAERIFAPDISPEAVLAYAESFFTIMTDFRFLPNAPALLGAGGPLQQLAACYVLPIEDSIESIFETLRMAAIVHSRGSGTGFNLSALRPRGTPIATGGVSTGPVSFMRIFDMETEIIKQGGTGWGANMGMLRCDHPDIQEFVTAKSTGAGLQNFNISVGVTDEFMRLSRTGGTFALVDPQSGRKAGTVNPRELLDRIALEAWKTGDPGLLFLDRIERDNPTPQLGRIEVTNPCGEAPLLPYEGCWLGGINVAAHLDSRKRAVDWESLRQTCSIACRMMDNALEVSSYPLPQLKEATQRTRKLGIGVMGFADMLVQMNIPYGSPESESLARDLMSFIQESLEETSVMLGRERGVFPAYPDSRLAAEGAKGRRNATVTANAPNSTIAAIAGCSSGIEPIFSIAYSKQLRNGDTLNEIHPEFLRMARSLGFYSERLVDRVLNEGSIQSISEVPQAVKDVFLTAHDISAGGHIRIQSAFQDHIELAVAKTINLANHARPEDVKSAFLLAGESGCKGITCFRDGCRDRAFLDPGHKTARSGLSC